jgi:hypothetical protein
VGHLLLTQEQAFVHNAHLEHFKQVLLLLFVPIVKLENISLAMVLGWNYSVQIVQEEHMAI